MQQILAASGRSGMHAVEFTRRRFYSLDRGSATQCDGSSRLDGCTLGGISIVPGSSTVQAGTIQDYKANYKDCHYGADEPRRAGYTPITIKLKSSTLHV